MVVEFTDVVSLNNSYQAFLTAMAQYSNTNDDVLLEMIKNLMSEYRSNYKLLEQRQNFEHEMFMRNKKMEDKRELIEFKFKLRKMKFMCKQAKRANRLLFAEFRKENNVKAVADSLRVKPKQEETTAIVPVVETSQVSNQ